MGFPIFPNVPNVAGVPSLLRFPTGQSGAANAVVSIVGNVMTATNVPTGDLIAGSVLSAAGLVSGTKILNQINGIPGDIGQYAVNVTQSFSGSISSLFTPPNIGVPDALGNDDPLISPQLQNSPQWGIFNDGGDAVIIADQVTAMEYRQDWRVSSFPLEQGAFESYDKIATPYEAKIRFTSGGSIANRQKLLQSLDQVAGDLKKYSVAVPERTFLNANIKQYSFSRQATNGLGLLKVDVELEEIRESATTTNTNTKAPSGQDQVNDGTKQPQPATTQQKQSVLDGVATSIFGN